MSEPNTEETRGEKARTSSRATAVIRKHSIEHSSSFCIAPCADSLLTGFSTLGKATDWRKPRVHFSRSTSSHPSRQGIIFRGLRVQAYFRRSLSSCPAIASSLGLWIQRSSSVVDEPWLLHLPREILLTLVFAMLPLRLSMVITLNSDHGMSSSTSSRQHYVSYVPYSVLALLSSACR